MQLTPREKQIVKAVVKGRKRQAIADDFGRSVSTVDFHLLRIRRKFRLNSMLEIAVFFSREPWENHTSE